MEILLIPILLKTIDVLPVIMDVNNVIPPDIKNVMDLHSVNLVIISKLMDLKNVPDVMLKTVLTVLMEKTVDSVSLDSVYGKTPKVPTPPKRTTNVLPVILGVSLVTLKKVEPTEDNVMNVDLDTTSKTESATNPEKCAKSTPPPEEDVFTVCMDTES